MTDEQDDDILDKKEKLLLELIISNAEVFVKSMKVVKPEYFEKPLDRVANFIIENFNKHNTIATPKIIEAETDVKLEFYPYEPGDEGYALHEIEKFCQDSAMGLAIMEGVDLLKEGNLLAIQEKVRNALMVKMDDSIGMDVTENPTERITNFTEAVDERAIGINAIDCIINNVRRKELGILYAVSGGGKSLGLANISVLMAGYGLDVSYITLELSEELSAKRIDCMATGVAIKNHVDGCEKIADYWSKFNSGGSIVIKKMPFGTTSGQIRLYLMDYFLKRGKYPDVLIVDYIGIMGVDGMSIGKSGVFEMDHVKTASLRELAVEFNMYGFSAGQINRDGYGIIDVNASHCAGGISAVNNSDWAIAMVASEEDKDNNQVQIKGLKLRNAGHSKPVVMYKCPYTLKFSDEPLNIKPDEPKKKDVPVSKSIDSLKGKEKLKSALNMRKGK